MKGCVLEVNPEELGWRWETVYHFVDPDLDVEIFFEKEGTTEKGGCVEFEIMHLGIEIVHWG